MERIEANRLTAPGERAARDRVEVLFEEIDRLSALDLNTAPVPHPDPDERERLLADLSVLAGRHGRTKLLEEARDGVREALLVRFVNALPSYPYGVVHQAIARTEDQAAIVAAAGDAAAVAVMDDVLDPAVAAVLTAPWRQVAMATGADADADHGEAGGPEPGHAPGPGAVGAPSREDWIEAARGTTAIRPGERLPGVFGLRAAFFAVTGVIGVVSALAAGFGGGQPLLGVLGAVAVAAVCWTLATYRGGSAH